MIISSPNFARPFLFLLVLVTAALLSLHSQNGIIASFVGDWFTLRGKSSSGMIVLSELHESPQRVVETSSSTTATASQTNISSTNKDLTMTGKDYPQHRTDSEIWIGSELTCTFRDENDITAPLPVILISTGRAGSSVTWDTITRLLGRPNIAFEYTGGNMTKSQIFFDSIDPAIGNQWGSLHLCQIQGLERVQGSGICGFQWKPYFNTFKHHPLAKAGLEEMSNRRHPPIRFIFLTRNAIDREISNIKHKGHIKSPDLPAHCPKNDTECARKHSALGVGVRIPTEDLIHHLIDVTKKEEYIQEALQTAGVKFARVSFEQLYDNDNVEEWKKIFRFLGRGPSTNLTIQQVHAAFSMERTSSRLHKDVILNYEEVRNVLNGTRFQSMLN